MDPSLVWNKIYRNRNKCIVHYSWTFVLCIKRWVDWIVTCHITESPRAGMKCRRMEASFSWLFLVQFDLSIYLSIDLSIWRWGWEVQSEISKTCDYNRNLYHGTRRILDLGFVVVVDVTAKMYFKLGAMRSTRYIVNEYRIRMKYGRRRRKSTTTTTPPQW